MGRDFDEIVRSANFNVVIGRDDARGARPPRLDRRPLPPCRAAGGHGRPPGDSRRRSGPLVGTPEQIIETLRRLQGDGLAYAITYFAEAAYDNSGIALFEQEVMPELVDREEHGHKHHLFHRR